MHANLSDRGAALLTAVMITALVAALAASLAFVVVTESRVGHNYQAAQSGGYAATAGVERLIGDLRRLPGWIDVPSTASSSDGFNDGRVLPTLSDGTSLDLTRITGDRQAASDAFYPAAPNRPVWSLYAHASMARIASTDPRAPGPYVVVWVADDADETDGDPSHDSNGVILVRAEAFGARGGWRAIEATLSGSAVTDVAGVPIMNKVSVLAWREAR
jgi:hypothetical protein